MTPRIIANKEEPGDGDLPPEVRIEAACNRQSASMAPDDILANLQPQVPELRLCYAMVRTGWYRLGGVVDADYERVAQRIGEWAEAQCDGDLDLLMDKCANIHGFATRLEGCTHYITAVTGERAQDFVQVEVEQVQEVIERPLWDPDWMPDDLEDFIDPLDFPHLEPEAVGPPRLLFRRLVRVADFLDSDDSGRNIKRFLDDWDRSSVGESTRFCDHWILSIREYRDTQGDGHLSANPIPLLGAGVPDLPDEAVARGATLANLIHGFDRHRGYHFAWYFHMLTQPRVSYQLAQAVHADLMGAFDYLPARDIAVLRDWYNAPYSLWPRTHNPFGDHRDHRLHCRETQCPTQSGVFLGLFLLEPVGDGRKRGVQGRGRLVPGQVPGRDGPRDEALPVPARSGRERCAPVHR